MRFVFIIICLLLLEFLAFKAVNSFIRNIPNSSLRLLFRYLYWGLTGLVLIGTPIFFALRKSFEEATLMQVGYSLFGLMVVITVPKLLLILFSLPEFILHSVSTLTKGSVESRRLFLTKLGGYIAVFSSFSIIYGIVKGRYQFTTREIVVPIKGLPKAFEGFTIAQISDMHLGSFFDNTEAVQKGIQKVIDLNADMICFTGDLVNNKADEAKPFAHVLKKLSAPYGVYSVLGNHDYGDYYTWKDETEKQNNLSQLKEFQRSCGFDLLLNEKRVIEKEGDLIELVGVENWGKPPFVQYGNLSEAIGPENKRIKVLMSHDPSHWTEQVIPNSDIALTMAGHTHGMQFGIEIPGFKWSPVKWKYPQWAGLYSEENQHLYVNRGFGYLGFPGRVGIWPEITKLTLTSA